ncbi:Gypsy retrotransposon integrase-like protein 1 [Tilletia horrida]|nr:Gypsy retrotransposon integrase-like protein 1 [Tilletia horrida]
MADANIGSSSGETRNDWETAAVAAAAAAAAAAVAVAAPDVPALLPPPPPAFDGLDGASTLHADLAPDPAAAPYDPNHSDAAGPAAIGAPSSALTGAALSSQAAETIPAGDAPAAIGNGSAKRPRASTKGKGKQKESSAVEASGSKDGSEEQQIKKRRRVVVACDTCRRKKIRCKGLPNDSHTCDNCATYGYKCAFTFSVKDNDGREGSGAASAGAGKGRTRGRYEILEAKIDSLLSIIRNLDPEIAMQWESGELGAGAGALTGVKKFGEAKPEPNTPVQPPTQAEASSSTLPSSSGAEGTGGRGDDNSDPTWFNRYQLPEPQAVASLLSTYFSTFHPLMPIVHRRSLERDLAFGRAEHDTAFRGLVFTLLAIASRLGTSAGEKQRLSELSEAERKTELEELEKRSDYYAAGSRMYHQVYAASLINVQVLLLTATFMHSSIGAGTAWTVLGVGIRILLDIGLHSERAYAGFSPFEQELRRRVFWGAYILDSIFAANMGRPPTLRLEECAVKLPLDVSEDALFEAEKGGPIDLTQPKGDQGSSANVTSGFIHLAKLNVIVGDVLRTLYFARVDPSYYLKEDGERPWIKQPTLVEADLGRLLQDLDEWAAEMPAHLKGQNVEAIFKLQAGILTCGVHDVRLYIMKPFLQQERLKAKLYPQCIDHARKLLDWVLKMFEDVSTTGIVFLFQQAFWSAATFMITVWHHYKNPDALAADQHLIEGTLKFILSSDPHYFSSIMHRALRLLQSIARRAMSEMEPARRERVSAYVNAEDPNGLSELASELARAEFATQPLHTQFGTSTGPNASQRALHNGGSADRTAGERPRVGSQEPWVRNATESPANSAPAASDGQGHYAAAAVTSNATDSGITAHVQDASAWIRSEVSAPGPATSASAASGSGAWSTGSDGMHAYVSVSQASMPGVPGGGAGPGPQHQPQHQPQQQQAFPSSEPMPMPQSMTYFNRGPNATGSAGPSIPPAFPYIQHFAAGHQQQQQHQQHHQHHDNNTNNNYNQHHHNHNHGHHQQGHHAQHGMVPVPHAEYPSAQPQFGFENSFADAHGIAAVQGPNPSLDDLAWTDYFASFLASLSSEGNGAPGPEQQQQQQQQQPAPQQQQHQNHHQHHQQQHQQHHHHRHQMSP